MQIRDFLRSRGIGFQVLLHNPAPSSTRLAKSVHVPGRQVAKGVLVWASDEFVLAVLPSTSRIELDRLSDVLGGKTVRLATEDEIETTFGDCERGALPPIGRLYGLDTVVDASLSADSEIVCVGNARHEGVRLLYRDYAALEQPMIARFATPPEARRIRRSHRQAG